MFTKCSINSRNVWFHIFIFPTQWIGIREIYNALKINIRGTIFQAFNVLSKAKLHEWIHVEQYDIHFYLPHIMVIF